VQIQHDAGLDLAAMDAVLKFARRPMRAAKAIRLGAMQEKCQRGTRFVPNG
jgi:hypothetical protein